MTGKHSREKGKRGEREAARALTEVLGLPARRGQQYDGTEGKDVVTVPGLHVEVKRVESLRLYPAIEQAKRDAADGEVPIVLHRKNGREWLLIVPLASVPPLIERVSNGATLLPDASDPGGVSASVQ